MCARSVILLEPRMPTDEGRWGGITDSVDRLCDRWPASELFLTLRCFESSQTMSHQFSTHYAWRRRSGSLSKKCHSRNTIVVSGYISDEREFEWWYDQNRCTYDNVYLQVPGTPRKCCSRSQQRSSPGLRLGETALLVFIERVRRISHYLITSFLLLIYFAVVRSTFHTRVVDVTGLRDTCQAVLTTIFPSGVSKQLLIEE